MIVKRSITTRNGFALAGVLWILAGLSIVVAMFANISQTAAERTSLIRKRADFMISSFSARAELQYWLSLSQTDIAEYKNGKISINADGSLYKFDENSLVSLQDQGGLINIATIDRELFSKFLEYCEIPPEKIPSLIDSLLDYTDEDNLQRINGAEKDLYSTAGMRAPRNSALLSNNEIWSVYGWNPYRKKFEDNSCINYLTIYGETTMLGTSLNLATAPEKILLATGLTKEQVHDMTAARNDPNLLAERAALNNQLAGVNSGMFGNLMGKHVQRTIRVTHLSTQGPWQLSYILQLDSSDKDRPWRIIQPEIKSNNMKTTATTTRPWPINSLETLPRDTSKNLLF